MKLRIVAAALVFFISLVTLVVSAGHLGLAIDAFSPLDPTLFGPLVPGVTRVSLDNLPKIPIVMGLVAVLTTLAALYFWRCRRPVEVKAFAVVLLACVNLYAAAFGSTWFLNVYFMLPKVMNSA